jgi:dynein heavy chain
VAAKFYQFSAGLYQNFQKPTTPVKTPVSGFNAGAAMNGYGNNYVMLGDLKFLHEFKEFIKNNIPAVTIERLQTHYLFNPAFNPSLIKNISSAWEALCK